MHAFIIDKIGFIFADALKEVISTTTGFSFEISSKCSSSESNSEKHDFDFDEIIGLMSLNGKNHGMVFISAEETAMRIICSFMTGIPKNELTKNDIEDALCELVNMTAGNAKLRFNATEQSYSLSPPFLFRGENISVTTKKRVSVISKVLGNSEISIKLRVVFY